MIVIIPCGARKLKNKTFAKDLYIGPYFKMNLKWAKSVTHDDCIFILSAKHGLLNLYSKIEPYDLFMGSPGSVSSETINKQAIDLKILDQNIFALGGSNYISALKKAGIKVCAPVRGPMGVQMGILKKNIGKKPKWVEVI